MPPNDELTFDAATHVYRHAGRIVPSVTQVLGILADYSFVDPERLEAAAAFGTNVHAAIDLDNRGELDEAALDLALAPYVCQWREFIRTSGFVVIASEQRVYNKALGYAGTCDTLIGHGSSWVLDIKTGKAPRWVGAQLAAYQQALEPRPRRRLCLELSAENFSLKECKNVADFSLFQSCLNIWRFQHESRPFER